MVAGVKGVAFLDGDTMAVTSSTCHELFLVSASRREVLRSISLGGDFRAESLCVVPGTRVVLVADGLGTVCRVDTEAEPAAVSRAATSAHHAGGAMRLTSVCAWDAATCFVAGAVRGAKTECGVRRVDLAGGRVAEVACLAAPMVRALCAEPGKGRILVGAIDVADEGARDATTRLVALASARDFRGPPATLATVAGFVHAIAPDPRREDVYVLLGRHGGSKWAAPVTVVRLLASGGHAPLACLCAVERTLPITFANAVSAFSYHGLMAGVFGVRAGREHAMALAPDGTLVTGCVDKGSKGVLQLWSLDVAPAAAGTAAPPGAPNV